MPPISISGHCPQPLSCLLTFTYPVFFLLVVLSFIQRSWHNTKGTNYFVCVAFLFFRHQDLLIMSLGNYSFVCCQAVVDCFGSMSSSYIYRVLCYFCPSFVSVYSPYSYGHYWLLHWGYDDIITREWVCKILKGWFCLCWYQTHNSICLEVMAQKWQCFACKGKWTQ